VGGDQARGSGQTIPSIPKAKVLFLIAIQGDRALKLLQRQNPDVPTANWKILCMATPLPNEGGQSMVLQINKEAEDLLYPRYGKMAWGMGSVYLRLKKRHSDDKSAHILQAPDCHSQPVERSQPPMTLRVLQLNLHKSRLASAELLIALIGLVPWIASGNIVAGLRSSNYNTFYSSTVSRNRSAVLVRKGIHANLMPHYSSDDLTTVMIESVEQRLLVASCYMATTDQRHQTN